MGTRIHVSGLSYFCTDATLRQAFIPFGEVVIAQVLRDVCGHSLGLGIAHMACSDDVERVFNEHQRFVISDSRVDLWEPADPEGPQVERIVVYDLRQTAADRKDQNRRHERSQRSLKPLAVPKRRLLVERPSLSPWTVKH